MEGRMDKQTLRELETIIVGTYLLKDGERTKVLDIQLLGGSSGGDIRGIKPDLVTNAVGRSRFASLVVVMSHVLFSQAESRLCVVPGVLHSCCKFLNLLNP